MKFPELININDKINLYVLSTKKFKTTSINVFIHRPLNKDATKNALIPLVLRRGTQKFQTYQDISEYLEQLYGAIFNCTILKKGERQILKFYLESIDSFHVGRQDIFEKSLSFLSQVILNPYTEDGIFKKDYITQEKENLKKIIESKVNDKMRYSKERCIEIMCEDEPFSIYKYGNIEDLQYIDSKVLYDYYRSVIKQSPIDIFIIGDIDSKIAKEKVKDHFNIPRDETISIPEPIIKKQVNDVNKFEEQANINQAKLCLGLRTNVLYNTAEYYSLILYSNILGGGTFSKLFVNVRENANLAYTIFTQLDKFKGLMFIQSGIDFDNYKHSLDIIFAQIQEIKKGNITDEEYYSSIKRFNSLINTLQDSHTYIADFFLSGLICGSCHDFETLVQEINSVKKDDILKVSNKVELDTIYFLHNSQNGKEKNK